MSIFSSDFVLRRNSNKNNLRENKDYRNLRQIFQYCEFDVKNEKDFD